MGNDVDVRWNLDDAEGSPYILEGKNVAIEIVNGLRRIRLSRFELTGNTVHFVYPGKDQTHPGHCDLVFIENEGGRDMITFDTHDAFELVRHSWEVGSAPANGRVQVSYVSLSSRLDFTRGPKGDKGDVMRVNFDSSTNMLTFSAGEVNIENNTLIL